MSTLSQQHAAPIAFWHAFAGFMAMVLVGVPIAVLLQVLGPVFLVTFAFAGLPAHRYTHDRDWRSFAAGGLLAIAVVVLFLLGGSSAGG